MSDIRTVGFIGLGNMGGPMAANLVKGGFEVRGFDVVDVACAAAARNGVTVTETVAEAVDGADVVITMLPAGRHVLDCYGGADGAPGVLASIPADTLLIDCSTIAAEDSRAAHEKAQAAGHRSIDAPVSGGVGGATAGTLTFMVGANEEDFTAAQPVFEAMGAKVVHCGIKGAGQAAKLCNNMILGASMVAVSEAFVLGRALGLTDQALFDVSSTATGQCWALTTNCPAPGPVPTSPANRDYQPGFSAALMTKDLRLAAQAADTQSVAAELGRLTTQRYEEFLEAGGGDKDFSAIILDIAARSGSGEDTGTA